MSLCWQCWCSGQQSFTVSGIDVSGSTGTMSVSVGQFDYGVISGENVILIAGVQQPFDTPLQTNAESLPDEGLNFDLYPNPTTNRVILKITGEDLNELSYRLIDADGKELETAPVIKDETIVSLNNFRNSVYFLIVMNHSGNLKIFKIIKN
jgi:hypothetical protein